MGPEAEGSRLDVWLSGKLETSRSRVQRWIRDGRVSIDGEVATRASQPLQPGLHVHCDPAPQPAAEPLVPEPGALAVVWEDEHLLAVDKPAGMAMHPGAGRSEGTLAHRLLHHHPDIRDVGHPRRPGIVHRLDLGTSGVVVVAKTQAAYLALAEAFAERRTRKQYVAIVYGRPQPESGTLRGRIGRDPADRKRMKVAAGGRAARTDYRVAAEVPGVSRLDLEIHTGRTHQIRVHLKSLGHPVVGDPTYGEARWKGFSGPARRLLRAFPRPALHAARLTVPHPASGESVSFEAALPRDMEELWSALRAAAGAGG